jgi:hypothetical protein
VAVVPVQEGLHEQPIVLKKSQSGRRVLDEQNVELGMQLLPNQVHPIVAMHASC